MKILWQLIFSQFFKVVIGYTTWFLQDISKNVRILELIAHVFPIIIRNGHILMMYLLYTVEKSFCIVLYFV